MVGEWKTVNAQFPDPELRVFDDDGLDHIAGILTFICSIFHDLVDFAHLHDFLGIFHFGKQPFNVMVEQVIGLVLNAVNLNNGFGDLAQVFHVPQLLYRQANLLSALLDQLREPPQPFIVLVNVVEHDLLRSGINMIGNIVKSCGQVVDVLPVERRNKIPAQLGKNPMGCLVVFVLKVCNLGHDGGPVGRIGFTDQLLQDTSHQKHSFTGIFEKGIEYSVFRQKYFQESVECHCLNFGKFTLIEPAIILRLTVNDFLTLDSHWLLFHTKKLMKRLLAVLYLTLIQQMAMGQYLMDVIDTTKELGKANSRALDRFNHIRISGYMQPQYQIASEKGASSYSGGDFAPQSSNRFMLRRGRLRFDYALTDNENRNRLQFVFQFDGTERGVFIRDFWGRYWENKLELLALTTGMFARPFGFEINYSSADRESPERGRMSQTLMRTERDLGLMASIENRRKSSRSWKFFRIDAGLFNGQGLTAPGEFDDFKDFIGQLMIKPQKLGEKLTIGGGVSALLGGLVQTSAYTYRMQEKNNILQFVPDSITTTPGAKLPRKYYGINTQLKYKTAWGFTEVRGECWTGTQTANQYSTATPDELTVLANGKFAPFYIRPFNGGFFYFLQHIASPKHQIVLKYDWYDPNTKVSGLALGAVGSNFTGADVRYQTWGAGYVHQFDEHLKLVLYYEWVKNELTLLQGYTSDKSDNILTLRAQFRF